MLLSSHVSRVSIVTVPVTSNLACNKKQTYITKINVTVTMSTLIVTCLKKTVWQRYTLALVAYSQKHPIKHFYRSSCTSENGFDINKHNQYESGPRLWHMHFRLSFCWLLIQLNNSLYFINICLRNELRPGWRFPTWGSTGLWQTLCTSEAWTAAFA